MGLFGKSTTQKIEEHFKKLEKELKKPEWKVLAGRGNYGKDDEYQNHINKLLIKGQEFYEQKKFVCAIPYFIIVSRLLVGDSQKNQSRRVALRLLSINYFKLAQEKNRNHSGLEKNSEELFQLALSVLEPLYEEYLLIADFANTDQTLGLRIECLRALDANDDADILKKYQQDVIQKKLHPAWANTEEYQQEQAKREDDESKRRIEEARKQAEKEKEIIREAYRRWNTETTSLTWPAWVEKYGMPDEEEIRRLNTLFIEFYKAEEEFLKSKDYKPTQEEWFEFDQAWYGPEFDWMGDEKQHEKAEEEEYYSHQQDPKPYQILGVSPDAPLNEIKKKYRMLILKNHPDKGGDEKQVIKILRAWHDIFEERKKKKS